MKKQVVISHPNWLKLMKQNKTLQVKVDKFEFSMQMEDDVLKAMDANPVIQQKLWDVASKEWKAILKELDDKIGNIEDDLEDIVAVVGGDSFQKQKNKIIDKGIKAINSHLSTRQYDIARAVEKEWEKLKKQKKLSRNFKISTAFKAVGKVVGMTTSIASLVASGGINAMAYYTLARTLITGYNDLKKLTSKLKDLGDKIEADTTALTASLSKHPKLNVGKEVANTLTFLSLGTNVVNTHSAIYKDLGTYKGRIAAVQQKQISLGKDVKKLMDKIASEKKKVDKTTAAKMIKLETKLGTLLTKTAEIGAKVSENDAMATKLTKSLNDLKGSKGAKILNVSKTVGSQVVMLGKIALNVVVLDAAGVSDAIVSMAEDVGKAAA